MAAPSSVVENRRLVDRVALSDYFISTRPSAKPRTKPPRASFLPPPHPPNAFVSCLSPPYRKVISPLSLALVRETFVKWMDRETVWRTFYPILEFKDSFRSFRIAHESSSSRLYTERVSKRNKIRIIGWRSTTPHCSSSATILDLFFSPLVKKTSLV